MQSLGFRSWSIHKKCIMRPAVKSRIGSYCLWWVLLAMRMLFHLLHLLHMDLWRFILCLQASEPLREKVWYLCCSQRAVMSSFEVCSAVGQRAGGTYPISRVLHLLYKMKNSCIYVNSRQSASRRHLKIFTMFPMLFWATKSMLLVKGFLNACLHISCNKRGAVPVLCCNGACQCNSTSLAGVVVVRKKSHVQHCMSVLCMWLPLGFNTLPLTFMQTEHQALWVLACSGDTFSITLTFWKCIFVRFNCMQNNC